MKSVCAWSIIQEFITTAAQSTGKDMAVQLHFEYIGISEIEEDKDLPPNCWSTSGVTASGRHDRSPDAEIIKEPCYENARIREGKPVALSDPVLGLNNLSQFAKWEFLKHTDKKISDTYKYFRIINGGAEGGKRNLAVKMRVNKDLGVLKGDDVLLYKDGTIPGSTMGQQNGHFSLFELWRKVHYYGDYYFLIPAANDTMLLGRKGSEITDKNLQLHPRFSVFPRHQQYWKISKVPGERGRNDDFNYVELAVGAKKDSRDTFRLLGVSDEPRTESPDENEIPVNIKEEEKNPANDHDRQWRFEEVPSAKLPVPLRRKPVLIKSPYANNLKCMTVTGDVVEEAEIWMEECEPGNQKQHWYLKPFGIFVYIVPRANLSLTIDSGADCRKGAEPPNKEETGVSRLLTRPEIPFEMKGYREKYFVFRNTSADGTDGSGPHFMTGRKNERNDNCFLARDYYNNEDETEPATAQKKRVFPAIGLPAAIAHNEDMRWEIEVV